MAISMADLKKVKADKPPRLVIYGPEGMGKTSLAHEFPNTVFLQTEEGETGDLELDSFGLISDFNGLMDALGTLYAEEHVFQHVCIDTTTSLEKLVWAETCKRHSAPSIEKVGGGFGKGYKEADYVWQEVLDGLNALRRDRNMGVLLLAHSEVSRFDDPTTQSYSRYDIDLHDRAKAMINRDVDAILLIKQEVSLAKEEQGFNKTRNVGQAGETRWIYCQGRPAFTAKNRYGMPDKLMYQKGQGYAQLAPFFPQPTTAGAAAQAA